MAPSGNFSDLLPPYKNLTHSTSFCNTRGQTPILVSKEGEQCDEFPGVHRVEVDPAKIPHRHGDDCKGRETRGMCHSFLLTPKLGANLKVQTSKRKTSFNHC